MLLENVFRNSDFLIRWGGEEFLVVARFSDRQQAQCLAERLRASIHAHAFKIDDTQSIHMTGSIGFSCFPLKTSDPQQNNWTEIVSVADKCLYAAKKTTRNAWLGIEVTELGQQHDIYSCFEKNPQTMVEDGLIEVKTSIAKEIEIIWE